MVKLARRLGLPVIAGAVCAPFAWEVVGLALPSGSDTLTVIPASAPKRVTFGSPLGGSPGEAERPHARAELVSVGPLVPGVWNELAVVFRMDDGWHIYADTHNDTGFATKVDLALPEGWEAGPVVYPAPKRYVSPGDILDHVYEGAVVLFVPVRVPEGAAVGEVEITGQASWLVCKEACIPGDESLTARVRVGTVHGQTPAVDTPEIAASRARIPEPWSADGPVRVVWDGTAWRVAIDGAGATAFYPLKAGAAIEDALTSCVSDGGALTLVPDGAGDLSGIVEWTPAGGGEARRMRVIASRGDDAGHRPERD